MAGEAAREGGQICRGGGEAEVADHLKAMLGKIELDIHAWIHPSGTRVAQARPPGSGWFAYSMWMTRRGASEAEWAEA